MNNGSGNPPPPPDNGKEYGRISNVHKISIKGTILFVNSK
jgi:hypothetical protein